MIIADVSISVTNHTEKKQITTWDKLIKIVKLFVMIIIISIALIFPLLLFNIIIIDDRKRALLMEFLSQSKYISRDLL